MKTLQIISLVLVCFVLNVNAQDNPFVVDVSPRITNGDTQISFVAFIPDANINVIEKRWMKYVAMNSRGAATFANGIHRQTNALNANVSDKPFDVSSKIVEISKGVKLSVWMDQDGTPFRGDGTRNNGDLAVQNYLRDFAVKEYKEVLNDQLIAARKKQKELEVKFAKHSKHDVQYAGNESDSNSGDVKKNKQSKKQKPSQREADKNHEQLALERIEIDAQKKIVEDTKVRLTEVR